MSRESFKSFEDLQCWKACTEVRRFIAEFVKKYPKEEKFALIDDMKRAARSTTHNLAERVCPGEKVERCHWGELSDIWNQDKARRTSLGFELWSRR